MDQLFKTEYLGWEIEIHCVSHVNGAGAQRYTSSAHATLKAPSKSGELWIDARTQVVTLGNRDFASGEECVETLLADVRELIDALKK